MSIINIVRVYCDELLDGDAAPGLGGALWPSAPSDSSTASTIASPSSYCLEARWIAGSASPPPSTSTASSLTVLSNDIRSLMSRSGFKVDFGNGGLSALFWGAGSHRCCRQYAIVVAAIAVVVITAADIIVATLVVDGKLMLPQADGHHR